MVRAYIAALRAAAVPEAWPPPPTVRRVTGRLIGHRTALSEDVRAALKDVLACCSQLDAAAQQVRDLGKIRTSRLGLRLPAWIDALDASQRPGPQASHFACSETSTP
ncbi:MULTISPECIES: hypothetical protein [unclassified Streptomyces]|uniref:hypothetical protein n=1 Tax=unclassified Streptomyces TaxID=2593676 RepID=UPI003D904215